ncbi:hypothetical protein, partial [Streptococcus pneumoniae]|uniref:hypothetical protein n=1 Tax=Streptococcus pneumoniae TaxID=1313 RepID=UPI0006DC75A6
MKDYKINFDLGKIEYFDNNCLIQVYKFISFYDICEMVFAFHLPPDELITNVIFKPQLFTPNLKTIQNPCLSLDPGWFL